ncbi:MAG: Uma2 family endonuclease [Clostridiales bacterium]|jgi:Uma2 family endonuclease|nr:Uma2 family endonuclease [Clostridiales bacterium]
MAIREEDLYAGRIYSHEDYMTLDFGKDIRYELVDGELYLMAAPSIKHQEINGNLHGAIWNFLRGKKCKVFAAPFAVKLKQKRGRDTTLQPDLSVVCDLTKINDDKACVGAPELVIEILSPSTAKMDKFAKLEKYLHGGAQEYWIVDPADRTIQIFILKGEEYVMKGYLDDAVVTSAVLPGLEIPLSEIFPPEEVQEEAAGDEAEEV